MIDRKPPRPPEGDEEIPGRDIEKERRKRRDPGPKPPEHKEPGKPKREKLPPDPDQPQAPVRGR